MIEANRDLALVHNANARLDRPMHVQKCLFDEDHLSWLPLASSGGFATTCLQLPSTGHAVFAIFQSSNMPVWTF